MFGTLIPFVIIGCASFLLLRLRFFFFSSFGRIVRTACVTLKLREPRRSFFLALAGTLGVGNIVGVAVGLIVGGAGSVFWLVVSSFFSMILKYAEASLSALSSNNSRYGMISLISLSHKRIGHSLSVVYAALCVILAFFMGGMLQSSSVCSSFSNIFGINGIFVGILLSVFVLLAILSKTKGIINTVSFILPFASVLYLLLCAVCICKGIGNLPAVISDIFGSAFSFGAFSGGFMGFLISSGFKEGFSRGLLSNEAGAGTSTLAHAQNSVSSPAEVGILGMGEVVLDTLVFCPVSAVAILVSVGEVSTYPSGIALIMDSIGSLFTGADVILSICIFIFVFATVICWYCYGSLCVKYIFGRGRSLFSFFYLISVFLGSVVSDIIAVAITDVILLLLTVITSVTLIKSSGSLVELSERGGLIKRHS